MFDFCAFSDVPTVFGCNSFSSQQSHEKLFIFWINDMFCRHDVGKLGSPVIKTCGSCIQQCCNCFWLNLAQFSTRNENLYIFWINWLLLHILQVHRINLCWKYMDKMILSILEVSNQWPATVLFGFRARLSCTSQKHCKSVLCEWSCVWMSVRAAGSNHSCRLVWAEVDDCCKSYRTIEMKLLDLDVGSWI